MKLVAASLKVLKGLEELIADLGAGENGFGGTPVHSGELTVQEYLARCVEMPDASKLKPGLVPQTIFWLLDDSETAVGMVRIRHYLNEKLLDRGGHIGYYLRKDQRGKGYGRKILELALKELTSLGEGRALLTVDAENRASRRVIEANAGKLDSTDYDQEGTLFCRYWVELSRG